MKTLISVCAALILLFPPAALSQRRPDWFTVGQYNFEINLPSRPTNGEITHFKLIGYEVYGETIEWLKAGQLNAAIGVYRPFGTKWSLTEPEKTALLAAYKKMFLEDVPEQKLTISESPYSFSGSKGVEIRGVGVMRLISRLFFAGNRLYTITVSSGVSTDIASLTKVLDSFRLLTKTETIAALKLENEIAPVSQARPALRLGNDVQAEGLKGSICGVVDEMAIPPSTVREMFHEAYFDRDGNLVREVTYDRGYPQQITQWGWIDGKRISSTRIIFYELPDAEARTRSISLGPTTGMMGNERRNTLFGLRHEFSYDGLGRIIEQKAYKSNDKLNWSKKFTNSTTGREIQTFDETGGFLARTVEMFDKNGNVIESRILDMSGGVYSTVRFAYEFDQGGNWIVRKAYTGGTARPKAVKPESTVFRTITYCD